jgi:dihydroflavonol-4-reductase
MTIDKASISSGVSRVFVTGGTGFLGAYIIRELVAKQYRVTALRRSSKLPFFIPAPVLEQVQWVEGDILDVPGLEDAMQGCDAVVHAAAKVSFVSTDQNALYKTNIEGTSNVVNTALEKGIKRLLYVSSVAVLGRSMHGATVNEGNQWADIKLDTSYARSKYHAEMEVWRAIGEGLNAVIVNPSTVLGFGDWNSSSCAIFKNVYEEFPWYTNGENGFVDVEDIARAVVRLMQEPISQERFILSASTLSFRELLDLIADGLSKKHPSREATPLLAAMAWRLEKIKTLFTGSPSLLTQETARVARGKTYFDNSKILKYLPDFTFTPIAQTIKRSCAAYLEQAGLPA